MTQVSKVVVNKDLCIGAATCLAVAPDIFDLDSDGKAYIKEGASLEDVQMVLDAAGSCPTSAISVYDAEGNQIYPQ